MRPRRKNQVAQPRSLSVATAVSSLESLVGVARSEQSAVLQAANLAFPGLPWTNRHLQPWQKQVGLQLQRTLNDLADVQSWPLGTTALGREIAIRFWLLAPTVVEDCSRQTDNASVVQMCAAQKMYPEFQWPPLPDVLPFLKEAWNRLGQLAFSTEAA